MSTNISMTARSGGPNGSIEIGGAIVGDPNDGTSDGIIVCAGTLSEDCGRGFVSGESPFFCWA